MFFVLRTLIFARRSLLITAVPQPNLTKSMYSAADDTRSVKYHSGIPPSITIVSPVSRGFSARRGRCSAVGFICFPFLIDS